MNDETLMEIAARSNPVPDAAFRGIASSEWAHETLAGILATPVRRAQRWARTVALAGAAAALVALLVAVVTTEPTEPRRGREWGSGAVRMAEESPRLLITTPGWRVTRAENFGTDGAEMTFENDRYWVDVHWYPGELYERYVGDRRRGADATSHLRVAGNDAVLFRHDGMGPAARGTTFYVLWQAGPHAVELRTDVVPTLTELREIAAGVEVVGVDEWLGALPEGVVGPDERRRAIEQAAEGLPLPPGFDLEAIAVAEIGSRDSLEFDVATAVACAWIDRWAAAEGSREAVTAAEALSGARRWPAFRDGNMQGGYVEDVAAAMREGESVHGSGSLAVADGYRRHLGCAEGD